MSEPIELSGNHLSSIIACMLKSNGATSYTMTFEEYKKLDLENTGLECTADYSGGKPWPGSITVTIRSRDEL